MSKRVTVVLAGCGVYDGSEILEAVLTLLALDRQGVSYQCLAPNISQMYDPLTCWRSASAKLPTVLMSASIMCWQRCNRAVRLFVQRAPQAFGLAAFGFPFEPPFARG
jgi:hypothetical protein